MNLTDLMTPEQLLLNATLAEVQPHQHIEAIDRLMPFVFALQNMKGKGFTATSELIGLMTLIDQCIRQSTEEKAI